MLQIGGEGAGRKTGGRTRPLTGGPAAGRRDVRGGDEWIGGRRQCGRRPVTGSEGKIRPVPAPCKTDEEKWRCDPSA